MHVSATTVTVKATAPAGNPGIEYSEASVLGGLPTQITVTPNAASTGVTIYKMSGGKTNFETPVPSSSLACSLTDLSAATEYTVDAKTCSSKITKAAWTPPNGQFKSL